MKWNPIESPNNLEEIINESGTEPVFIFKHSTRCSISSTALDRMQRAWKGTGTMEPKPYFLDLLAHRDISSLIAEKLQVTHQSPQVLLIYKGKCVYNASHLNISYLELTGHTRELLQKA